MFTLKLYSWPNQRIIEAESITAHCFDHGTSWEITAHQKDETKSTAWFVGDDRAHPAQQSSHPGGPVGAEWHEKAIIENSAGRTTQIFQWDKPSIPPELSAGGASASH